MKKIPVWKNILLIFSLIASIIIATLAWFYTTPAGAVEGVDVNVGEASFIQISGDNGNNWSEELEVEFGINKNFREMSGNGTTFFTPVYDVIETPDSLTPTVTAFEKVVGDENYYEQVFSFRSDASKEIYLTPESFVTAVSEDGESYIDGAIRVAFFELDDQDREILKCIWAPNSKTEYSNSTNSFTKDGNVETYYHYQKSVKPVDASALASGANNNDIASIPTGTANGSCSGCGYHAASKFMWTCGSHMPENAPALLVLDGGDGQDMSYGRLKIRVWLEGYDRECVSLIKGQKFTMKFQFNSERGG